MEPLPLITILSGPTATGKTAVALALANRLHAAIINADSRQVYRGFDIGTAKPSIAEQALAPHFGIDVCDPDESWTAGRFFQEAQIWIREILAKGQRVIVVGGSGLYVRVLTRGIFEGPPIDEETRRNLRERLEREGLEPLCQELAHLDPDIAATIDNNNPARVLRALEVCLVSGMPYSALRRERMPVLPYRSMVLGLAWDRQELYGRIDARVDAMFEAGFEEEVRGLLETGVDPACLAMQSVGYKELVRYLTGSSRFDETVSLIKQHTRNFAKRQLTWFRREPGMTWLQGENHTEMLAIQCAEEILKAEKV